jgi:SAM-dependent methyltransferase
MLTVDFDRIGIDPGDRVLDLGCGGGRHAFEALRRGARVTAADLDEDALADIAVFAAAMEAQGEAPSGATLDVVRADALALPFADGTFDHVIASEVLEHIRDDRAAMRELVRVLKPGGSAAVTVPRYWPEAICWALSRDYHSNEGGHVRIYREAELTRRLKAAGLAPRASGYAHALHSPYWWIKCAVGVRRDDALLPRAYHRFLVWDLEKNAAPTRLLEKSLNPIMGKSLVVYAAREGGVDA